MRIWHVLVFLTLGSTAFADRLAPALTADDIHAVLKPVADEIEHCYLDRTSDVRGAGQLELVLAVSRRGELERLDIKTPNLPAKLGKDIASCIRAVVPVAFPARRTFTTATVPYFFLHTAAPNAGPQLSCWNPNGCHARS